MGAERLRIISRFRAGKVREVLDSSTGATSLCGLEDVWSRSPPELYQSHDHEGDRTGGRMSPVQKYHCAVWDIGVR